MGWSVKGIGISHERVETRAIQHRAMTRIARQAYSDRQLTVLRHERRRSRRTGRPERIPSGMRLIEK